MMMESLARHRRFITDAWVYATASKCSKRHGAVIARGNRLLGADVNTFRNAPSVSWRHATVHAEARAIAQAARNGRLKGATIYVARASGRIGAGNGKWAMSRPCDGCMALIRAAGIKLIVYTNEYGGYSIEEVKEEL